jgi:glyoxylase-like metal-dependent hydrolase (beta-lactamase superfamily II)
MKLIKTTKKSKLIVRLILLILSVSVVVAGQEKVNFTQASYERAKQTLDAGIRAHGGMENIRRADKITINYKAVNHPLGQNAAFDAPPGNFERVGARSMIDYAGNRYISEGQTNFPGGYKFNFRFVVAPQRSFSIDVLQNRRGSEVRNVDERTKTQLKIGLLSEVPHLLLLYAAQRPETLRWMGESEIDGQKLHAVSFAAENGAQMTLYFDAQTNLLARTKQLDSHALLGDTTTGNIFSDYQTIENVKFPRKRLGFVNQNIISTNEYADVKFDFAQGEKLLTVPAGFVDAAPQTALEPVRKMGDGVYLIEQFSYRVMFIEFDDYVMVLETPINSDISKAILRLVKQTVPNKPVKYVSFSHFHFDHSGGLREYIAEGATVIVPPGNKNFVEQIAKSRFTVKPDTLALNPRSPLIEIFEKKRVFTDGKRTIELYSIGHVSHVNEMVMFYFPKEKILFQGDMFSPLDTGGIPPVIEVYGELVRKVDELKLDVETLISVHSGAISWKEFRAAVEKSSK